MANLLAVDVGFSSVKIFFADGEAAYFKSTVEACFSKGLIDENENFFVIDGRTIVSGLKILSSATPKAT